MATAGYSGTALVKKLGIKEGYRIRVINPPFPYSDLVTGLPENIKFINDKKASKNFIHYFAKEIEGLKKDISSLRNEIYPNGMIWVSWPKKASKIETNVTEDAIRHIALCNGLVDVKVCAIDDTWSGLKLVIPLKDRI